MQRDFEGERQDFTRLERIDHGVAMSARGGVFRIEPALIIGAGALDGFGEVVGMGAPLLLSFSNSTE